MGHSPPLWTTCSSIKSSSLKNILPSTCSRLILLQFKTINSCPIATAAAKKVVPISCDPLTPYNHLFMEVVCETGVFQLINYELEEYFTIINESFLGEAGQVF